MTRTHLQCLYMNEHNMGNKQEQSEVHAQLQSTDPTGINRNTLNSPHDWNAAIDGYKHSGKKGWEGKEEEGCTVYKGLSEMHTVLL